MSKNTSALLKVVFVLVVLVAASIGAAYLAGAFMLLFNKAPVGGVELTTYYRYWSYYHDTASMSKPLRLSALGAILIAYGLPLGLTVWALVEKSRRSLHGDARFANATEVRMAGLMGAAGIILGKWRSSFLLLGGRLSVALLAPTRSWKGVSFAVPNSLNWRDSLVANDPKQELYKLTAGFRAKYGQEVFLFNPFAEDYRTARYNPLAYVRDGDFRVGDLITMAEIFFPPNPKDPFFDLQAQNLFVALGLYLCETPTLPRTIGEMLRQASGKGQPVKDYLQGIINERNFITDDEGNVVGTREWSEGDEGLPPLSQECVDTFNRFLTNADKTFSSIMSSFNAPLLIWTNPIVDAATSANDFDLRDLRKKRFSVYIGITPDHQSEAGRLVGLLFAQLINLNLKELPEDNPALKYEVLMLMDEFASMGRISVFVKAISIMAGYGLRAAIIAQSFSQLRSIYGEDDARTIMTNCGAQIIFAPREQRDANDFSDMLGYETVTSRSKSRAYGGRAAGGNISESEQRRALLLPQEIKEIGVEREIIVLENTKPILCDKVKYYEDRVLKQRLLPAPAVTLLDMDTHRAFVQARVREMTVADVEAGIDLKKLALDTSKLVLPQADGDPSPAEVQALVDSFFDMLDAADCAEDGTCPPPSAEELAVLDAAVDEENFIENFSSINLPEFSDIGADYEELANMTNASGEEIDLRRLDMPLGCPS
jgi:type IV secretion system protein VirD4